MYSLLFICLLAACRLSTATVCNGHKMIARGVKDTATKNQIVKIHNDFRKQIATGNVANQPRGINLKKLSWSNELNKLSMSVSSRCQLKHINQKDSKGTAVGQNIYMSWSSANKSAPNWKSAIQSWFDEHSYFQYPHTSKDGKDTGHYTQVVWASTTNVGCDFIYYYNEKYPKTPFTKLYTCDYHPSGNYKNVAPYQKGKSGCKNLC